MALAGIAFLGFFYSTTPRLPDGARFVSTGRRSELGLREAERQGFKGRFVGRTIRLGNNFDTVDLGLESTAARAHGRWRFSKKTVLVPLRNGVSVDGEPLNEGQERVLAEGDVVAVDGRRFTYQQEPADDANFGGRDDEDDVRPRRGWRRKHDDDD
jgi:hypothetical protein